MNDGATLTDPRIFDWTEPHPWSCPRCQAVTITIEAAPRCERCGYREAAD